MDCSKCGAEVRRLAERQDCKIGCAVYECDVCGRQMHVEPEE